MATKGRAYHEPEPVKSPFCAAIGMKLYKWNGNGKSQEKQTAVDVFDPIRESWKRFESKGEIPTMHDSGASVAIGNELYTYGGEAKEAGKEEKRGNELHKLDTVTMQWTRLGPKQGSQAEWPSNKTACKMVVVRKKLALFGGFTPRVEIKSKKPFHKSTFTGGPTDEFHFYDTMRGEWTSLTTTGDFPPPSSSFSFTSVDAKRTVFFGGMQKSKKTSNDLFIIDWETMQWKKIPKSGSWPLGRKRHAACCLNYGQQNPQVLMAGGVDENGTQLRDMWLLDVDAGKWTKLPDLPRPARESHIMMAFPLSSELTEVTMFGGKMEKGRLLAHTTIIRLEKQPSGEWKVINIIEPSDVGRPIDRVQEKMESLGMLPSTVSQSVPSVNGADAEDSKSETHIRPTLTAQSSFDARSSLSTRSKRSYVIDLSELTFGKQLGEGAYGTVYAGTWKARGGVEVAIKKCFNRPFDAEILSVLPRHPNVVLFYATAHTEDATYIVTELVSEGSLHDYIHKEKNPLDVAQGISWAKQIAYGMEHLHGHNLVHRDLKSGNVLISDEMMLKVCDFGTAREVVDKCEQSTVRGTYRWMAPEIMKEDDAIINKMCDVFSYGCVLYELFEQKLPYHEEKNSVFLAMKVLQGLRPTITNSTIPDFLKDLMQQCWLEEPDNRPDFEQIVTSLRMKATRTGSVNSK